MIQALLGAVQFLTVLPVRSKTAPPGRSAVFFPLVGAWIGILGAVLLDFTRALVPTPIAALMVLGFWASLTGGLHEDAFADCVDAYRAGRPRDKILTILKDSRIGAHGAIGLILSTLIRWQALGTLALDPVIALAAAGGISRAGAVALAWTTPPVGSGSGFSFSATLTTFTALLAILQAALLGVWCGARLGTMVAAGAILIVVAARRYFLLRTGGVTGDGMGAVAHAVETYSLIVFTCRSCIS
jgi:adenosylcobinamide-GDP ribazoletransferase